MAAPFAHENKQTAPIWKLDGILKSSFIFSQLIMVDLLLVRMSSKTQQFWL